MTPPSMGVVTASDGAAAGPVTGSYSQVNGNRTAVPLDFSTTSSSSSEEQQPVNPRERMNQAMPTAAAMLATFNPEHSEEFRRKYHKPPLASELRLDRDIRDYGIKVHTHMCTHIPLTVLVRIFHRLIMQLIKKAL